MEIVMRKTTDLIPYENNPRKNDGAVEAVANSIKEFGFKVPIVVDAEGVVVAGHTRLKAAEQLGLEEVPVIVADDLTDEQIKAFRIADNKTGDLAIWDNERLRIELEDLTDIDMTDFGFGDFELTMLTEDFEPETYNDEVTEKYGGHGDEFLERERVIITYRSEQAEDLMRLLGLSEVKKIVYDLDELL